MSGTHAHGLQMCGCPARGGRRAGREVASVLRWCGGGCRWAVGALFLQTRRIATAAMAAITSNSVRSGRFIGYDSSGSLGVGFRQRIEFPSPLAILVPELAEAIPSV